jgi:hypothetical protein
MSFSNRALPLSLLTLVAAVALPACGTSSGSSGAGGGCTTASDSLEPLTSCLDDDITDSFAGPGYDASKGGLQPPVQATYVAATTVLLESPDPTKQATFGKLVTPVMAELPALPGLVGYQLAISSKCHYARTLTVWKDTASLMGLVMSPSHVTAMGQAAGTSDGIATVHWDIAAADMPPTWAVVRQQIASMGHRAY